MNGRDVVTRMRSIEDNATGETGEDAPPLDRFVAVLLDLDYDGLDVVLADEARRVVELQAEWYRRFGVKSSSFNYAALGFVQGVTFAVAAQRMRAEQ
jgi:hypothetical protein